MRINGLFWNIDGGDRAEIVAQFAAERDLDIVVLCESAIDVGHLLDILAARTGKTYAYPASALMRLQIFRRSHELGLEEIHGSANGRLTVRRLNCNGNQLLFAAAHLISKREWGERSQQIEAQVLATELRDVEQRQGHRRTILVGDLNLNPFEEGIVGAGGLHAMMSKAVVAVGSRIVQDKEYPFFYNP